MLVIWTSKSHFRHQSGVFLFYYEWELNFSSAFFNKVAILSTENISILF